jgi:hypothetical protein
VPSRGPGTTVRERQKAKVKPAQCVSPFFLLPLSLKETSHDRAHTRGQRTLAEPVLDSKATYCLEVLVSGEEYQTMLPSYGSYQEIELRRHAPCRAKILKKLGKFGSCLFVGGPEAE